MREKPSHLKIIESLDSLGALSQENKIYLSNLKKGYDGEKYVDALFSTLKCAHFYVPDRLLRTNRHTFQLDAILVTGKGVYLYEIKNYRGEYIYENNTIKYYMTGKTILKPSTQLERTETFFKMFLEEYRINVPIYAYVIFINSEFTLYQMPPNQNVLMASMLNKHLKELDKILTPLNSVHKRLVDRINERHISDNKYADIPKYSYDDLRKGPTCLKCQSFEVEVSRRMTCCLECHFKELNTEVILRKCKEFKLLFPKEKLSTRMIYDWCGEQYSKKSIQCILQANFRESGARKGKYYY